MIKPEPLDPDYWLQKELAETERERDELRDALITAQAVASRVSRELRAENDELRAEVHRHDPTACPQCSGHPLASS